MNLREAVEARSADTVRRLRELVAIPSVSAPGHDPSQLGRSAAMVEQLLGSAGMDVRRIGIDGAPPYVFGQRLDAGPDAPTVLLYAHHDVQPVPTPDAWTTPAFEPTERDGRLYGRGAADDKAGVMIHVAALEAFVSAGMALPCNVKVIVEGEEEIGSPHMRVFLDEHAKLLAADAVVVADGGNWDTGVPTITYLLRGIAEVFVTVSALDHSVHSMASGPVPDALTGLIRALATLHRADGTPAVEGLTDDMRTPTPDELALVRALGEPTSRTMGAQPLDGVELIGDPAVSVYERQWMRPSILTVGLDVPSVNHATNQLIAMARAKISIRLAPGQDPSRAADLVAAHVRAHIPWGLRCDISTGGMAAGWSTDPSGRIFDAARKALSDAYGRDTAIVGIGGTIPFVTDIAARLGAPVIITGVGDPDCRAHGEDESMDLADLRRAALGEALLLAGLGSGG